MNRILLDPDEIRQKRAILTDLRAKHLLQVVRVKVGSQVRIGLIDGPPGLARIESIAANQVVLGCEFDPHTPRRSPIDLILALPRPKALKRILSTLASLGVRHIALTNAWRVERNYFDTHLLHPDQIRKRLLEGLSQAGDTRLPSVSIHKRLRQLLDEQLDSLFPQRTKLFADPGGGQRITQALELSAKRILVAIGPEGGWIDGERSLFTTLGFETISLGPRTLKTEIACSVILGLIHESLATARQP